MTHQQVTGAPDSSQSWNSFAGDWAMFPSSCVSLTCIYTPYTSPNGYRKGKFGGRQG